MEDRDSPPQGAVERVTSQDVTVDPAEATSWLLEGRFFTVDPHGAVTMWSPPAAEAFGWSRKDLVGSSFTETLVAADDRARLADLLAGLLGGRESGFVADAHVLTAAGVAVTATFAAVPIHVAVGYEFNAMLNEIASSARTERSLIQLKARHEAVRARIEDAVGGRHAGLGESAEARRLAGALIAFRAVAAPPRHASLPDAVGAQLAAARHEADSAHTRMEDALHEAERLRGELAQARARAGAADTAEAQLERARRDTADATDQLAAVRRELGRQTGELDSARARLEALESELTALSAEAAAAERAGAELASVRELLGQLESERTRAQRDAAAEISRLGAELDAARARSESMESELRRLSGEAAEARADAERARGDLKQRPASAAEPPTADDELAALAAAELERAAAAAREESARIGAELDAARARGGAMESELAALSTAAAEARAGAERARGELTRAETELAASAEREQHAGGELRERVEELGRVQAELAATRLEGERAAAASGAELARLTAELEAAQAELEWSRQRAERAAAASAAEMSELTAELEHARAELGAVRDRIVDVGVPVAPQPAAVVRPPVIGDDYWQPAANTRPEAEQFEGEPLELDELRRIAQEVDAKNRYTAGHAERVAGYAVTIAEALGAEADRVERIREAALLHDVGKRDLPDAIVAKDEPLNLEELDEVERHSAVGRAMLAASGLADVAEWVYHLHERYDGGGYPGGLAGVEIPEESRILHAADALDHMTRSRAFRKHRPLREALAELSFCAGTRVDPRVVEVVVELVEAERLQPVVGDAARRGRSLSRAAGA